MLWDTLQWKFYLKIYVNIKSIQTSQIEKIGNIKVIFLNEINL